MGNLDSEDGKALAGGVASSASLTHCNVLRNHLDVATATLLVDTVKDKTISLAGIQPDQTTADFEHQGLMPPDAILLASDLSKTGVNASLTSCNVLRNNMDSAAANSLVEAVKGKAISLAGIHPDQTVASFSGQGLESAEAILVASDLSKADVSASLTSLTLDANNIRGTGYSFGEALKRNSSLKELVMRGCSLDAEDGKGLAASLAVTASLTSLGLGGNKLQDEGIASICDALQSNQQTKLVSVNFSANEITTVGAKSVAALLAVVASLTAIDVSWNKIDQLSARALLEALKDKDMQSIGMAGCNLGVEEAKILAEYASVMASLTSCDVSFNELDDASKTLLQDCVEDKPNFDLKMYR